jgi:uncharacterized protein (TIGR02246 family)
VARPRFVALLDAQIAAVRAKDVSGLLASYAPDVVVFDLVNSVAIPRSDALRKRAAEWLSSFEGPWGYEARDVRIVAGDDLAYCHSLNRVTGTTTLGKEIDMSWRATLCCRKIDGTWMVTPWAQLGALRHGERPSLARSRAVMFEAAR